VGPNLARMEKGLRISAPRTSADTLEIAEKASLARWAKEKKKPKVHNYITFFAEFEVGGVVDEL